MNVKPPHYPLLDEQQTNAPFNPYQDSNNFLPNNQEHPVPHYTEAPNEYTGIPHIEDPNLQHPQFIQNPYYPAPEGPQYQFIEAPHIDEAPKFGENTSKQIITRNSVLQCLHANAACLIHKKKTLKYICEAPICRERLLCELCFEKHNENLKDHFEHIVSMQDFFNDNDTLVEFEKLCKETELSFDSLENMHLKLTTAIITTFDQMRNRVLKLIRANEEEAKEMARDYILSIKDARGWSYLKRDYLAKKEKHLTSNVGVQNQELDSLIEVINKIKQKEIVWENQLAKTLKTHSEQIEQFVEQVKNGLSSILSSFSPKLAEQIPLEPPKNPLKIDASLITYQREFKVDHRFIFNAMTYINQADQIVTGSDLGVLSFWDLKTSRQISTIQPHKDVINSILYIEKEGALLTASKDKTIAYYSVNSRGVAPGSLVHFKSHSEAVKSLLYLEGERKVASAGEDSDIKIWDLNYKSLDGVIKTKGWKPNGDEMAYIKLEKWIAAAGEKEIRIYDYKTKELLMSQSAWKSMGSLSLCLSEKFLVGQSDSNVVKVWKINHVKKSLSEERKLKLPESPEDAVYFRCFEESDLILVSLRNDQVLLYNLTTGTLMRRIYTRLHRTSNITLVHKHRKMIIGDSKSNLLGVLDY